MVSFEFDYDAAVADHPPLTREQRDRLAVLLRPALMTGNGNQPKPPIDGKPVEKPDIPRKPIPPPKPK
jgi:hypothetical protein